MTTDRDDPDRDLDALFAHARGIRPEPSPDLLARILADAEATARARPAPPRAAPPQRRPGWLPALMDALGGWPALGGLAATAVLGLTLGVAQPTGLATLAAPLWGEAVSVSLGLDDDPLGLLEG